MMHSHTRRNRGDIWRERKGESAREEIVNEKKKIGEQNIDRRKLR